MTREVNYFKKEPPGPWAVNAACRGSHGTHFPDAPQNSPEFRQQVAYAKLICARCPVKAECLDLAIRNREREGVWGGEVFGTRVRNQLIAKFNRASNL